ncbi:MAG: SDR family NAD(P)-dependent oxidoreductase [Elusimicrobiota bacterium]|nr:SDR family NAD(P)-dependent oxidoreductase [Elusimicrobiota bacterium]
MREVRYFEHSGCYAESGSSRKEEFKTLLVTGAGGTIGGELARQVLALGPKKVVLLENHNTALFYIDKELREKGFARQIVSVPGDVRDESLLKNLFETHKPAWVLHAAVHKHVALMEERGAAAGAEASFYGGRYGGDAWED